MKRFYLTLNWIFNLCLYLKYRGLDKSGSFLKGLVEAENLKTAKQILKKRGIFLQEIKSQTYEKKEQASIFRSKKVNTKELAVFTRLLSSLLRAGVPLVEALNSIVKQTPKGYFCSSIAHLRDQINEGKPFYMALKEYPLIFDPIYVSLCESGEG